MDTPDVLLSIVHASNDLEHRRYRRSLRFVCGTCGARIGSRWHFCKDEIYCSAFCQNVAWHNGFF